jgi:hypothetical protein
MNEIINDLKIKEENIHKLKGFLDDNKFYGKTTGFAESLFKHFEKRGELSDKQWHWVLKLVDQVQNPKQEEPEKKLPNINGVYSLLRRAVSPKNKSFPKLWLRLDDQDIKISKASNKSRHKGQLFLSNGKWGYENIYFGRIDTSGDLYLSKDGKEIQEELIDLLNRLVSDPEKVASEYGKLTGNCFACHKQLSDDRSIEVGYGKVCADKFGLRWG